MDDGFDAAPPQQRGDRPPRVSLKAIGGIDTKAQVSIFYKASRNDSTVPLIRTFSREALTVFSDRARRDLQDGSRVFTITGGDKQAIKDVVGWIMECKDEGKAAMFQTYEEDTPKIFTKYALAIEAANYLGIPARDFAEGLTRRLIGLARKNQMSWEEVEYFYDKYEDNGLRDVAAASVFYAWWRGALDEEDTPDDMCFLSVLREELPTLDDDLHKWAEKNEEDVRAKWAKKDGEKRGGGDAGGFADESGFGDGGGGGAGWDQCDNQAPTGATGCWDTGDGGGGNNEWDTGPVPAAGSDWDKENAAPSGGSSSLDTPALTTSGGSLDEPDAAGNDWADEVNDSAKPAPAW